jgi:hypothetical protein
MCNTFYFYTATMVGRARLNGTLYVQCLFWLSSVDFGSYNMYSIVRLTSQRHKISNIFSALHLNFKCFKSVMMACCKGRNMRDCNSVMFTNIALFVCSLLSIIYVGAVNFFALYSNHHLIRLVSAEDSRYNRPLQALMTVKEHWFIGDWLIGRLIDWFLFVGWENRNKVLRKLVHWCFGQLKSRMCRCLLETEPCR